MTLRGTLILLALALSGELLAVGRAAAQSPPPQGLGATCGVNSLICQAGLGCAASHPETCGGLCSVGGQCCFENGATPTQGASQCCSQTVSANGTCMCLGDGANCWDNAMCCSDSCTGTGGVPGTCQQPVPLQHACQTASACKGFGPPPQPATCGTLGCSSVDCRPPSPTPTGPCSDLSAACNVCCGIVFNPCSSNDDCCPGNQCVNGQCLISTGEPWCTQPLWTTTTAQNAACVSGTCNTTTGNCGAQDSLGVQGECTQNSDCIDSEAVCFEGECGRPFGASCSSTSQCWGDELPCTNGVCCAPLGGACISSVPGLGTAQNGMPSTLDCCNSSATPSEFICVGAYGCVINNGYPDQGNQYNCESESINSTGLCCGNINDPCATTSDCCVTASGAPAACSGGTCVQCYPNGDVGHCNPSTNDCCAGLACEPHDDASGTLENQVCRPTGVDGNYYCCQSNADCPSGAICSSAGSAFNPACEPYWPSSGGATCCYLPGNKCSINEDCCLGNCAQGVCQFPFLFVPAAPPWGIAALATMLALSGARTMARRRRFSRRC